MSGQPDFFRDFGILPPDVSPLPPETVRAYFPWGQVLGQCLLTCLLSGIGIGMGLLFALTLPFPKNILAPTAVFALFALFGYFIYRCTRNSYSWVELVGEKLRAKHFYTRRIVERSIDEIEDLLTLVFQVRWRLDIRIAEAWLGRVRGIMIRFRDHRTPLLVWRADPAMKNAKELIEAIAYRMSEKGEVDAEVINFEGKPLIRRIHWKEPG
jgi:hypothetical protein